MEKLKKEYGYAPDKTGMDELIRTGQTKRTLFTLAGKSYTGNDFIRFAAAYPAGCYNSNIDYLYIYLYLLFLIF